MNLYIWPHLFLLPAWWFFYKGSNQLDEFCLGIGRRWDLHLSPTGGAGRNWNGSRINGLVKSREHLNRKPEWFSHEISGAFRCDFSQQKSNGSRKPNVVPRYSKQRMAGWIFHGKPPVTWPTWPIPIWDEARDHCSGDPRRSAVFRGTPPEKMPCDDNALWP